MATASKNTVKKQVVTTVEVTDSINLTLTPEEAATLSIIVSRVGGPEETTLRKYSQNIYNALQNILSLPKISSWNVDGDVEFEVHTSNRAIHFTNESLNSKRFTRLLKDFSK